MSRPALTVEATDAAATPGAEPVRWSENGSPLKERCRSRQELRRASTHLEEVAVDVAAADSHGQMWGMGQLLHVML